MAEIRHPENGNGRRPKDWTPIWVALIVSIAPTIASVATLVKVEAVEVATNHMHDALVKSAIIEGHVEGVKDEKIRQEASDADVAKGKASVTK
jgi:hypothetical protein